MGAPFLGPVKGFTIAVYEKLGLKRIPPSGSAEATVKPRLEYGSSLAKILTSSSSVLCGRIS